MKQYESKIKKPGQKSENRPAKSMNTKKSLQKTINQLPEIRKTNSLTPAEIQNMDQLNQIKVLETKINKLEQKIDVLTSHIMRKDSKPCVIC